MSSPLSFTDDISSENCFPANGVPMSGGGRESNSRTRDQSRSPSPRLSTNNLGWTKTNTVVNFPAKQSGSNNSVRGLTGNHSGWFSIL